MQSENQQIINNEEFKTNDNQMETEPILENNLNNQEEEEEEKTHQLDTLKPDFEDPISNECEKESEQVKNNENNDNLESIQKESNIEIKEEVPIIESNQPEDKQVENKEEESANSRQNALLKQLLQNCPSADSGTTPTIESLITEEPIKEIIKEDEEIKKQIEQPAASIVPTENADKINLYVPVKEPSIESQIPIASDDSSSQNITTPTSEKKLSYLDIRRAQLEKEPTPPPEEVKPKRKRITKRKEFKSPDGNNEVAATKGTTKKRARKGSQSRADEDYELFLANLMAQLRSLPPLAILEPSIKPSFNVSIPQDWNADLNVRESSLRGSYGSALLPSTIDYYSTYPFGPNKAPMLTPSVPSTINNNHSNLFSPIPNSNGSIGMPSTSRGFYNEEFSKYSNAFWPNRYENDYIRYIRDNDSPDTIISSSSPECVYYEVPYSKYNRIKFICSDDLDEKEESKDVNNNRASPAIPIIAPIPLRPNSMESPASLLYRRVSDLDPDKDKENVLDSINIKSKMTGNLPQTPLRDAGNVGVTLTLSSADDIRGVLNALAKFLDIPPPTTYEIVERTNTPPSEKLGLYNKKEGSGDDDMNISSILNGKMRFCRFCEIVVLNAGIKKKPEELPVSARYELENEEEVMFCSTNCYMQFALSHRATINAEEKEPASIVSHGQSNETPNDETNKEPIVVKPPIDILPPMSPMMEDDEISEQEISNILSPKLLENDDKEDKIFDELMNEEPVQVENEPAFESEPQVNLVKKWRGQKYKLWDRQLFSQSTPNTQYNDDEEVMQHMDKMDICVKPKELPEDERKCTLCTGVGDGQIDGASRLLNMDIDKWIHLNCALWSSEVYETLNGALMNVDQACKRSMTIQCVRCHKAGASLKCFKIRCVNNYHFPCAIKDRCMFFKDKTLLCAQHALKVQSNEELTSFVVNRRVFVNRDEHKQIATMIHQGDQNLMRIGNLIFVNIGQLLPHQLQAFHTPNSIYPVGYKIIRFYWSMRNWGKRSKYICSINDVDGKPEFKVEIEEAGYENVIFTDSTPKGVWLQILESIAMLRHEAQATKLFVDYITGEDLFGLNEPSILRILESLPGVDTLNDYNFKYGRSSFLELPLAINPTGCARTEPKLRTHFKRPHTLHVSTSNSTRSSIQSSFSGSMEVSSPYIKQFIHSKSSQYRKMKSEWRNLVYLARSRIQGLGLYAARDIEKHTMVIEYIGLLIRNEIAERNERIYEAQVSLLI